jgi:hypothetical protein
LHAAPPEPISRSRSAAAAATIFAVRDTVEP